MSIPRPNAALIHEARMIAMVAIPMLIPVVKKLSENRGPSGLLCATCLRNKKEKPNKAATIFEGRTICLEHMGYLS